MKEVLKKEFFYAGLFNSVKLQTNISKQNSPFEIHMLNINTYIVKTFLREIKYDKFYTYKNLFKKSFFLIYLSFACYSPIFLYHKDQQRKMRQTRGILLKIFFFFLSSMYFQLQKMSLKLFSVILAILSFLSTINLVVGSE